MTGQLVDTHIHVITKSYKEAIDKYGDPSGYPVPTFTENNCLAIMSKLGVARAILSVTSPSPAVAGNGEEGRILTRNVNNEVAQLVGQHPDHFSFFASTPDWTDVQGTLNELDYVFQEQKIAVGVIAMTSYSDRLLGDPMFKPIWEKLNHYKAIVFIHPAAVNIAPRFIAGGIPQPVIDYPQNTTRTAADLLLTGRFSQYQDLDIILSHGGGTLPFLASRMLSLVQEWKQVTATDGTVVTFEEVRHNIKRFYYDTALCTSPPQLEALLSFGVADRLVFGSDFPYAPEGISISNAVARIYCQQSQRWNDQRSQVTR